MKYTIMTPGPTDVRENVMLSRAEKCTNPDLDLEFYDFYKEPPSSQDEALSRYSASGEVPR